ncbi:MAG: HD domain-containing phosphohydrolase, partial [Candidatus Eremiobacterota bacterium]
AEAAAEAEGRTTLMRTGIRPGLLPILPTLEQLFGSLGLTYRPEAEDTPEQMRSYWVAMAWLSQFEQASLSERMIYFGSAIFDSLLGFKRRRGEPSEEQVVNKLLAMLAAEGGFLHEHSLRVMTLSDALCNEMQVTDADLRQQVRLGSMLRDLGMGGLQEDSLPPVLKLQVQLLRESGDLHMAGRLADIGSLRVPPEIRNKPGPLTPEERAIMEKHPEYGEQFLHRFPPFRHLCPIVRAHHERFDGTGYPDGLAGRRIPMAARMIAVSDVWDALTSPRPWRDSYPFEEAYELVRQGVGTQFDPQVATPFLKTVRKLRTHGFLE